MSVKKISYFLFEHVPASVSYLVAVFLASLICYLLFTSNFLMGHASFFEGGDAAQHVSGWLFYVHDKWRFPLGYVKNLNYPEGANIILTDSIPLAAVFFKLIRSWLPEGFHYFGLWHALVYFLQAIAAVFLIRSLGYKSLVASISVIIFALLCPALTVRFGHTALTTQAVIMFALGAYVLGIRKKWSLLKIVILFILITSLSLLVHPYLFAMTYPIYLAFLVDFAITYREIKSSFYAFILSLPITLFVFFIFGYFDHVTPEGGFGIYSMNFLSPFCGGRFSINCSNVLGQYEGFNYLGLGLLLILIFVLITQWKWIRSLPRRFPALTALMIIFYLFALSNIIYFGDYLLFKTKLPHIIMQVASIFRSSGRIFWPVGYALIFIGIVGVLRSKNLKFIAPVLFIAIVLQLLDTEDFFHNQLDSIRKASTYNYNSFDKLPNSITALDVYPIVNEYKGDIDNILFFQLLAAKKHWLFNTAHLAHYQKNPIEKQHFFDRPLIDNHLYVILPDVAISTLPKNLQQLVTQNKCVRFALPNKSISMICSPINITNNRI